ncbi:MAG TPA: Holliday junction branch migration protein RuvA [bacterium]|nr:Holliday junction branch migration protein RuvA [bacterium]
MIAYLRGRIIYRDIEKSLIILDVNGIGYEVYVPVGGRTPDIERETSLFIYMYVREDKITLYGFDTTLQREIFGFLLNVKDVGPRLAVAVISNIDANNFLNILTTQDVSALSRIKGIGTAKAERIIMELKNKVLKKVSLLSDVNAQDLYINNGMKGINDFNHSENKTSNEDKTALNAGIKQSADIVTESAGALEALGYSKFDSLNLAGKVFGILKTDGEVPAGTEDLMRECLKYIYSKKRL